MSRIILGERIILITNVKINENSINEDDDRYCNSTHLSTPDLLIRTTKKWNNFFTWKKNKGHLPGFTEVRKPCLLWLQWVKLKYYEYEKEEKKSASISDWLRKLSNLYQTTIISSAGQYQEELFSNPH